MPADPPLSPSDRLVHGAIAAAFGAVLGTVAAVMLLFGLHMHAIAWSIAACSALYFFAVGWVRGADGGFFVGEALSALGAAAAVDLQVGAVPVQRRAAETPARWSSVCLLAGWLFVIAVLAWTARG
jgi:hypothetical protein